MFCARMPTALHASTESTHPPVTHVRSADAGFRRGAQPPNSQWDADSPGPALLRGLKAQNIGVLRGKKLGKVPGMARPGVQTKPPRSIHLTTRIDKPR